MHFDLDLVLLDAPFPPPPPPPPFSAPPPPPPPPLYIIISSIFLFALCPIIIIFQSNRSNHEIVTDTILVAPLLLHLSLCVCMCVLACESAHLLPECQLRSNLHQIIIAVYMCVLCRSHKCYWSVSSVCFSVHLSVAVCLSVRLFSPSPHLMIHYVGLLGSVL